MHLIRLLISQFICYTDVPGKGFGLSRFFYKTFLPNSAINMQQIVLIMQS